MDRVCGLDVHKDSVFMCILTANGEKKLSSEGTSETDDKRPSRYRTPDPGNS